MINNGILILENGVSTPQIKDLQEYLKNIGRRPYRGAHEFFNFPLINHYS